MYKFLCFHFALLFCSVLCFSQEAPSDSSGYFYSTRPWKAPRWYAIGTLRDSFVEWKSPKGVFRQPINAKCRFDRQKFDTERDSDIRDFELLRSGRTILVELNPLLNSETLTLKLRDHPECQTRFELNYAFAMVESQVKPFIFLGPVSTRYDNFDYVIYVPPDNEKSDIQMDIQVGYWRVSLSGAAPGASSRLTMLPVLIARGEWLPDFMRKGLGFTFALEQNLTTFGRTNSQSLSIAELNGGLFYEMLLPWADGFQVRFSGKIWQHQADDGDVIRSVGDANRIMFFPVASLSGNLYFGGRWLTGLDVRWGMKNQILSSQDQEMFEFSGRLGYRLTGNILWVLDGGARRFKASNSSQEWIYMLTTGMRLEL